ncbi:hypothetical protein BLOT_002401 [Blomia tropicalis]|nr:hypothetical protein BLOT_002401 [Blomia tropicalis]
MNQLFTHIIITISILMLISPSMTDTENKNGIPISPILALQPPEHRIIRNRVRRELKRGYIHVLQWEEMIKPKNFKALEGPPINCLGDSMEGIFNIGVKSTFLLIGFALGHSWLYKAVPEQQINFLWNHVSLVVQALFKQAIEEGRITIPNLPNVTTKKVHIDPHKNKTQGYQEYWSSSFIYKTVKPFLGTLVYSFVWIQEYAPIMVKRLWNMINLKKTAPGQNNVPVISNTGQTLYELDTELHFINQNWLIILSF